MDSKIDRTAASQTTVATKTLGNRSLPTSSASAKAFTGTGGFEKGQLLKGEIIDLRDRDIKIQLSDSRIITAHLDTNTTLSIGSHATFQVTQASLSSMSLKILSENAVITSEQMIDKALEEAGLPHTERNLAAVKALLENQMSINKGSIQNLLKQATLFPNASVETLVLMNKYHLPMTEVTTSQFEAYRNYEHRIVEQLDSLVEQLFSETMEEKEFLPLANHIVELLSKEDSFDMMPSPSVSNLEPFFSNEFSDFETPAANRLDTPIHTLLPQDSLLTLTEQLDSPELSEEARVRLVSGTATVSEAAHLIFDAAVQKNPELLNSSVPELISALPESLSNSQVYTIVNQYQTLLQDQAAAGSVLSSNELHLLSEQLKEAGVSDNTLSSIEKGDISGKELLQLVKQQLESNPSAKKLLNSHELQTVLKEVLTAHWTLSPKELTKPNVLEHYYERLDRELSELTKFSSGAFEQESQSQGKENFKDTAQNVRDNIDFMKTLNQMFTYVQLPMRLSNQTAHSELYVYTKKNRHFEDRHKVHVLLHLDMERLGPMDIHLNLNQTMLSAKFYIEDSDVIPLFTDNMGLLSSRLEKKGFQFFSEVLQREKPIDIVKDFIAPDEPEIGMKRYTFDIRA